ncbi:MAG: hypothetical protein ABI562_02415 [Chloroflexota bacterium]
MALLILAALLVTPVVAYFVQVGWPLFLAAEIGILLVAGWWFDRGRALGARGPVTDPNHSDFPIPSTTEVWQIPTEGIERPRDRPGRVE